MRFKRNHQRAEAKKDIPAKAEESTVDNPIQQPGASSDSEENEFNPKLEFEEFEKSANIRASQKRRRVDTKPSINVGIVGDTIEVKEFRAIVKKKGLQINVVLTELLGNWNAKNYNL